MPKNQRFKSKADEPKMPPHTFAQRRAASKRAEAAIEHINEARSQLDASCRDLCSLIGAVPIYREIAKLSSAVREAREKLDAHFCLEQDPFVLDHEPTDEEMAHPHRHGCGLGQIHSSFRAIEVVPAEGSGLIRGPGAWAVVGYFKSASQTVLATADTETEAITLRDALRTLLGTIDIAKRGAQ